ncbi:MAG: alpha/beta fold hydrolase [Janthinobacterium lividum]
MPIAVRVAGGGGPPLLLLHGAGCSLSYWGAMLPGLAEGHRVVAMDFRGHGRSGDGPWDVASLMADIEAVRREHGLEGGAIVGHSMGAVLAHLFADAHPDVPAVVNLDGFSLRPSEYVGLGAGEVVERKSRLHAEDDRPATYSADEIAGRVEAWVGQFGLDAEQAGEIVHSGVRAGADGRYVTRLSRDADEGIRVFYDGFMGERSLFGLVGAARCRSLVVRAERSSFEGLEDWKRELFAAYSAGVEAGLARIAACPGVRVRRVDAGHMLPLEQPALLVREIREFLAGA